MGKEERLLQELLERVKGLEHEAELVRTILIVKEPNTVHAAEAFEGLRRQVIASATERRSHLVQLASMATALSRATSLDDLKPQLNEWMEQAGIDVLGTIPDGAVAGDYFDDIGGTGLEGTIEIVEPAYIDSKTAQPLRRGRARRTSDGSSASTERPGTQDVIA
jgi:hypothetical protein